MSEIENPHAYEAGKQRRIMQNAWRGRRKRFEADIKNDPPEFRFWLFDSLPDEIEEMGHKAQAAYDRGVSDDAGRAEHNAYVAACRAWREKVGPLPDFLRESLSKWGGLTDGQLAFARKQFAKNLGKSTERDAAEAARRQNALPWTLGRQEVTVTLKSLKFVENDWHGALKGLWMTDDGRKLWCTAPAEAPRTAGSIVTLKVTIDKLADDDPTMAFGKRPSVVAVVKEVER